MESNEKNYFYHGGFNASDLKFQFFRTSTDMKHVTYSNENENMFTYVYLREGKIKIICNGETAILETGDMFLCKPLEKFDVFSLEISFFTIVNIIPSLLELCNKESKIYRAFEPREKDKLCIYKSEEIKTTHIYFQKARDYHERLLPFDAYKSLAILILFEICAVYDKTNQYIPAKFSHEYELQIYGYISSKALSNITIQDVKDEFFVSKNYINKVCNKFYSSNFSGMIKSIRMWSARGFMASKKTNELHEIAKLCGYTDYSAFYKNYKKYFGITPKEDMKYYKENKCFYGEH